MNWSPFTLLDLLDYVHFPKFTYRVRVNKGEISKIQPCNTNFRVPSVRV